MLSAYYAGKVVLFENDGSESFTEKIISSDANNMTNSVYAIDLDSDGDIDFLSAARNTSGRGGIAWYNNKGSMGYYTNMITPVYASAPASSVDYASSVYAVDVDSDGDMDVLSASAHDDKIAWYENDGEENFSMNAVTQTPDANGPYSVFAVDLDQKRLDFHDMKLIEAKNISYKINDRNILNNISSYNYRIFFCFCFYFYITGFHKF